MATINDLDPNIIHCKIDEIVKAEDYDQLNKEIEEKLQAFDKVKLIFEIAGNPEITPEAVWEDAKVSIKFYNDFEKIALIGSRSWIEKYTELGDAVTPFTMKYFQSEDFEEAVKWIQQ